MSAETAVVDNTLMSLARESIVLITVLIITFVAWFIWSKIVHPFQLKQAEISVATAEALAAIQQTTQAVTLTSKEVTEQAKQLAQLAGNLNDLMQAMMAGAPCQRGGHWPSNGPTSRP